MLLRKGDPDHLPVRSAAFKRSGAAYAAR